LENWDKDLVEHILLLHSISQKNLYQTSQTPNFV